MRFDHHHQSGPSPPAPSRSSAKPYLEWEKSHDQLESACMETGNGENLLQLDFDDALMLAVIFEQCIEPCPHLGYDSLKRWAH